MRDKHREFLRKMREGISDPRLQKANVRSEEDSAVRNRAERDLQQELNKKFDELFGPVGDD